MAIPALKQEFPGEVVHPFRAVLNARALKNALAFAATAKAGQSKIAALAYAKFTVSDGALAVSVTDLDIEATATLPVASVGAGALLLPIRETLRVLSALGGAAEVEISPAETAEKVVLRSGRSTFTLACLPPEDYPVMSAGELPHQFTLSAAEMRSLIDRTRFAISTEETRYYLNGIYLHSTKANEVPVIRAVATDGHRLARVEMTAPEGAAGMPGVIIPRKTIGVIAGMYQGQTPIEIGINAADNKARFTCGDRTIITKLIDGTFPAYERVFPKREEAKSAICDAAATREALRRVTACCSRHSPAVRMQLTNAACRLSVDSHLWGQAAETLDLIEGFGDFEIGLNRKHLGDFLRIVNTARFQFIDAVSPITVTDPADEQAVYLLMPLRV